mgnify:CR=1 FL=1
MSKRSQVGTFIGGRWWRHPQLLTLPYDLWREAKAFVHRGRYGWAPCDTWSLGAYLEDVLSGSVRHLARNTNSGACNMTKLEWSIYLNDVANCIDLYRYMQDDLDAFEKNPDKHFADEAKAYEEMTIALHRLVDRWGHLWD